VLGFGTAGGGGGLVGFDGCLLLTSEKRFLVLLALLVSGGLGVREESEYETGTVEAGRTRGSGSSGSIECDVDGGLASEVEEGTWDTNGRLLWQP
jgi:hypothetical protein